MTAAALELSISDDAFVFSLAPDASKHLLPDSVTQRYRKLAARLKIDTSIHKLRHYSATELIAGGADIRVVAGRLGHGGGGATTLRIYTAFNSEAEQRAAGNLGTHMPSRPAVTQSAPTDIPSIEPRTPYERVAVDLRDQILTAKLQAGLPLPSVKQLGDTHGTSASTAQRAINLLADWGLVDVNRGRRTLVTYSVQAASHTVPATQAKQEPAAIATCRGVYDLVLRKLGMTVKMFRAETNPNNAADLREFLVGAIRRNGGDVANLSDYDLIVSLPGASEQLTTFVAVR